MPGFSTIELGGTIVSPLRLNYDLSISSSTTVALAYSNASITDRVGLQVVIYNSSGSSITLTAGTQFTNYTSYPNYCAVLDEIVIPAYQSITLITTVIGQEYTIEAISGKVSIDGGAAGNIVYQTAANRTGFLAAGTPNYVLSSGGPNQPPKWSLLSTGNLAGGVAGSLLYQTAPSATAKSAVGTAFSGSGGGMAGMTSSTAGGWIQTTLGQGLNQSNFSGGTLTFQSPRAFTFTTQAINAGTSGNLYTFFTANSIPQIDGNIYTIHNNSASNYVLSIKNIANPNSWSPTLTTSLTPDANQITLYPNESITFQQFNSTYLTILSTSQSLQLAASYQLVQPPNNQAAQNWQLSANFDPQGWLTSSNYWIQPKRAGTYLISVQYTTSNAQSSAMVFYLQKNASSVLIPDAVPSVTNVTVTNIPVNYVVQMNGTTDFINIFRPFSFSTSFWYGGVANNISVMMLN